MEANSSTICEICGIDVNQRLVCNLCRSEVCSECMSADGGICEVCLEARCSICGEYLSARACDKCGKLVCEDHGVRINEVTTCSKCQAK